MCLLRVLVLADDVFQAAASGGSPHNCSAA